MSNQSEDQPLCEHFPDMPPNRRCALCEIKKLREHKRVLLELVREGCRVGHSIKGFVDWKLRAEFIIRNEEH